MFTTYAEKTTTTRLFFTQPFFQDNPGRQKDKPFWIFRSRGTSWITCKHLIIHHKFFMGRMLFLLPNQQCQSTEGTTYAGKNEWLYLGLGLEPSDTL